MESVSPEDDDRGRRYRQAACLRDLGIEGVQIEDKITPLAQSDKEQMFVDILPDIPEDDGCAYLTFYLERRCRQAGDVTESQNRNWKR